MIRLKVVFSLAAFGVVVGAAGIAAEAPATNYAGMVEPKVKPAFLPLPPGTVEPLGWLRDWAIAASDGLTGHLDEYDVVFRDAWKGVPLNTRGATPEGTGWPVEQCAYWLDGLLRLGYILHDDALIKKARSRLDPIVEGVNRGAASFFYWKEGKPLPAGTSPEFDSWAHSQMGRVLVALYTATGDQRILKALITAYCDYPVPMGHLQFNDLVSGLCNLDAMLETYRFSGDRRLLERTQAAMNSPEVQATVRDWSQGKFTTGHAVCAYEQLRLPALYYLWTGEPKYLKASRQAFKWLSAEHMLPYGVTSGEEWLAGIGAFRLTETCDVAAHLWSVAWLYRIVGERTYGDSMERAFFNAGPAPVARDFKTMCYTQSPNRIQSESLPSAWVAECSRFTPLGVPECVCCAGAINRLIPYYVMHMWMATYDGGLATTLYGPCCVHAQLGADCLVHLTCDTTYPFEEQIRISVEPDHNVVFPLYLRIPGWCVNPQILVNNETVEAEPNKIGFVRIEREWTKGDILTLGLPMAVEVARGFETEYPASAKSYFSETKQPGKKPVVFTKRRLPYSTVSMGPLLFALPIPDIDPNTPVPDAKWQYALDNDAKLNGADIEIQRKAMPSPWHWQLDAPIVLRVPACSFAWNPTEQQALPDRPVEGGSQETIHLVPYGCTKFRISMFPVTHRAWP